MQAKARLLDALEIEQTQARRPRRPTAICSAARQWRPITGATWISQLRSLVWETFRGWPVKERHYAGVTIKHRRQPRVHRSEAL